MADWTRRGFLTSIIVPMTISAAACTSVSPAQKTADRFMDAYYVQVNPKLASTYAVGLAQDKLQQQLGLLDGAVPSSANIPKVQYQLKSQEGKDAAEAAYIYEVRVENKDVGKRQVFVKVRQEDGAWKVTQFSEQDAEPKN